jgi:tungstate transport system substrate-binding protein
MIRRLLLAFALFSFVLPAAAQQNSIVVASTTSTQDSGLFGYLLPLFKAHSNIDV